MVDPKMKALTVLRMDIESEPVEVSSARLRRARCPPRQEGRLPSCIEQSAQLGDGIEGEVADLAVPLEVQERRARERRR